MMTIYWSVAVWLLMHLRCRVLTAILISCTSHVLYQPPAKPRRVEHQLVADRTSTCRRSNTNLSQIESVMVASRTFDARIVPMAQTDFVPRHAASAITDALADTRVVLVNGARQAGKSTLVR